MIADDRHLFIQRQAKLALLRRQFHAHTLIGIDDRQRALAAEDSQRIIARLAVNRHDAAGNRRFDLVDLAARAGVGNLRIQIPELKLQIGDRVIDILVGHHGEDIALLDRIAHRHAQIRQRTVRFHQQIRLILGRGCARAVNGLAHRAAHNPRLIIAFRLFRIGCLIADIRLRAKERSGCQNNQQNQTLDPFFDRASGLPAASSFIVFTHDDASTPKPNGSRYLTPAHCNGISWQNCDEENNKRLTYTDRKK